MKMKTSPVVMLDSSIALKSSSYANIQNAKKKGVQHTPHYENYKQCLFKSETTHSTNYSIRSKLHHLTVEKQNKLDLYHFDHKHMYLNSIKSIPWDKDIQGGTCPCL